MNHLPPRLFCFGLGFTGRAMARALMSAGWKVAGTCQAAEQQAELAAAGIEAFRLDRGHPLADPLQALAGTTHLLSTVPPDREGDAVLDQHGRDLARLEGVTWAGYLSTVGVYGDSAGAPRDETSPLRPTTARSHQRAAAETAWRRLGSEYGLPVHVFRLAGIYGPGRSVLEKVRAGTARRIDRPGHLFSRIHVDDVVAVLRASMGRPRPGAIYNVCDDLPAAPADVVAFACGLTGAPLPPLQDFETAAATMSPIELSFWRDSRRIDNRRIREELGVRLVHPDYRSGLRAILAAERNGAP